MIEALFELVFSLILGLMAYGISTTTAPTWAVVLFALPSAVGCVVFLYMMWEELR